MVEWLPGSSLKRTAKGAGRKKVYLYHLSLENYFHNCLGFVFHFVLNEGLLFLFSFFVHYRFIFLRTLKYFHLTSLLFGYLYIHWPSY